MGIDKSLSVLLTVEFFACLSYALCGQFSIWYHGKGKAINCHYFKVNYYSRITKTHQSIVPRGLYGSSSSFSSGPRRVLCWWSWQGLCRVALLRPILFFFVFFAVVVLFLLPSNKKTKVKMKMKAKKINSAPENAIISDLFTYHETSFMEWSHLHGEWLKS